MADGSFISAQQFEGVRPLVSLLYNSMACPHWHINLRVFYSMITTTHVLEQIKVCHHRKLNIIEIHSIYNFLFVWHSKSCNIEMNLRSTLSYHGRQGTLCRVGYGDFYEQYSVTSPGPTPQQSTAFDCQAFRGLLQIDPYPLLYFSHPGYFFLLRRRKRHSISSHISRNDVQFRNNFRFRSLPRRARETTNKLMDGLS